MWQQFKSGFIKDNPVFGLYLGMCSSLAISSTLNNAVGMSICVIFVLVFSNAIVSSLRKYTPSEIRIPVYIVIIASLVSVVEMLVHAFAPELYKSLGVFLSLVVVNCIILGRAEAFAAKNNVLASVVDGLGMGLGYGFSLCLIAFFREFLATGSIHFVNPLQSEHLLFGFDSSFLASMKIDLFQQPIGAFIVFGCLAALFSLLKEKTIQREKQKQGTKKEVQL